MTPDEIRTQLDLYERAKKDEILYTSLLTQTDRVWTWTWQEKTQEGNVQMSLIIPNETMVKLFKDKLNSAVVTQRSISTNLGLDVTPERKG